MGLAAGQARLLTITGRKSDCEYQSMRLSHQKLALSRQLTDVSNEYQNSLDQTKLVYDYYGTGDQSNPLSYGILMSPSTLNNYMPILVTDPKGRVTLNSKLAAAARKAGIPQEGFGTLPSEDVRNQFIQGLGEQSVITNKMSETIQGLPYNQAAGIGGGSTVAVVTQSGSIDDLIKYLNDTGAQITVNLSGSSANFSKQYFDMIYKDASGNEKTDKLREESDKASVTLNIGELLNGHETLMLHSRKDNGRQMGNAQYLQTVVSDILDQIGEAFAEIFDLGDIISKNALEYARDAIGNIYTPLDSNGNYSETPGAGPGSGNYAQCIGWASNHWKGGALGLGHRHSEYKLDINNMVKAYLTYIQDFVNGVSKTNSKGDDLYKVNPGWLSGSNLVTDDTTYNYTWKTGASVSSDNSAVATYYDSLFNQICLNGWTENQNIEDNEYLQEMLKSGMLFISKASDDGYYYQGNYATDSYIKEVSDETKIAQAEAKYNTEKAKLNSKEETLDLKLKNLDTEISSLTTEYDTVKNTISKNIEKSFKRYNA